MPNWWRPIRASDQRPLGSRFGAPDVDQQLPVDVHVNLQVRITGGSGWCRAGIGGCCERGSQSRLWLFGRVGPCCHDMDVRRLSMTAVSISATRYSTVENLFASPETGPSLDITAHSQGCSGGQQVGARLCRLFPIGASRPRWDPSFAQAGDPRRSDPRHFVGCNTTSPRPKHALADLAMLDWCSQYSCCSSSVPRAAPQTASGDTFLPLRDTDLSLCEHCSDRHQTGGRHFHSRAPASHASHSRRSCLCLASTATT